MNVDDPALYEQEFALYVADEEAMVKLGRRLGETVTAGVVFLEGELGAGKTTLCRGMLRARGYNGAVKSPTYTLVEPYPFAHGTVYHFDLYRLGDAEELEFMGIRDYFSDDALCLVEWPQRGEGVLPPADLVIGLSVEGNGRGVVIMPRSPHGEQLLNLIKAWQETSSNAPVQDSSQS